MNGRTLAFGERRNIATCLDLDVVFWSTLETTEKQATQGKRFFVPFLPKVNSLFLICIAYSQF